MVSQKNDGQDDSSDVKIISENKTNIKKENGESSKNAMDIDIDLDGDETSNFVSNKRERGSLERRDKFFRSNKRSPIKEELTSDSEADALVIDMEDESPKKKDNVKNKQQQSPAKRKRSTSSNKTNESSEIKSPPAKSSRRGSVTSMKKFDQVENELEAMFAGLEDEDSSNVATVVKNEKKSSSNEKSSHKLNVLPKKPSPVSSSRNVARNKSTDSGISCHICGNTFARKDGLRRHLETIHKVDKWIKEEPTSESIPHEIKNEANKKFGKKIIKDEPAKWMDSNKSNVKNEVKRPPAAGSAKKKKSRKDLETTKKSSKPKKEEPDDMNMTQQERLLEKFKGPFVHIEGDIENPRWSNVINFANDSLDPRNDSKHADLDTISRVTGFGFPLTTLSSKYDVRNVDESWICMFCRKSSHYHGLGDLFGPYFVTSEQGKSLNLPSPVKSNSKDLVSSFILGGSDQAGAKAKKRQKKKSGTPESPLKGCKQTGDQKCEVWFHEDCICWLPQIRLIGNQILGLPEAIKVTQKAVCSKCSYRGCTIACSQKKCRETAHFPCAQELYWQIDEDDFLARCANCVT